MSLPTDPKARKQRPIVSGVLDYFPDAIAEVAWCSYVGNEQHNPGQALHWDRSKSQDHADCIGRHLSQRGTVDSDKVRHSAKLAWRALALLQLEIEASTFPQPDRNPVSNVADHRQFGQNIDTPARSIDTPEGSDLSLLAAMPSPGLIVPIPPIVRSEPPELDE